jgi:hypothetical protein
MLIGLNRHDGDLMRAFGDIDDPRITFARSDHNQFAKMRLDLHARVQ